MKRTYSERRKVTTTTTTTRSAVRRVRKVSQPPLLEVSKNEPESTPPRSSKRSDPDHPRRARERLSSTPIKRSPVKEEDKDSFLSTDSAKSGLDFTPTRPSPGGNYRCKICGSGFERASLLKSHLIEHGNERAFPCFLCGVRFTTKWNLMKHQKCRSHRAAQSRESVHSRGETKLNQIM
ncbi:Immunodeficiency virus type I enhancer-binding protein [Fasciola gigantica]|uniref:Immunodeficiency virus type I enhancer-binding protein n=2 Tax=Fasciola TaxID=6191 RepID=A0A4E0RUX3_FASHE|nr:Immunodeficiency virus type I enhancer-binding protein [Fasciola hepatica]TPP65929.1 Immunodeficiency virus type I enhancer-binding protein [Fasciola gigantica]